MTTILCIEDDIHLLDDLSEELSEAGYRVEQARNGQDGLDKIQSCHPDLVISDISMPGMDGYDVLKAVRGDGKQYAQMPFIFLSALAARDERLKGLDAGADEYLTKPVDFDVLISKVQSILRMNERIKRDYEEDAARLLERHQDIYVRNSSETDDDLVLS